MVVTCSIAKRHLKTKTNDEVIPKISQVQGDSNKLAVFKKKIFLFEKQKMTLISNSWNLLFLKSSAIIWEILNAFPKRWKLYTESSRTKFFLDKIKKVAKIKFSFLNVFNIMLMATKVGSISDNLGFLFQSKQLFFTGSLWKSNSFFFIWRYIYLAASQEERLPMMFYIFKIESLKVFPTHAILQERLL